MQKIKTAIIILLVFAAFSNYAAAQTIVPSQPKTVAITDDAKNTLGTAYADNMIKKIESYIKSNNYVAAKQNTDSISQWIIDAAEYHTDLFKTLKKLDNAEKQADIERDLAIKFAVMRDKILFLQAQIFIHNNQKYKAVENLVEVMKSQPETELGFNAYKLLQDIGFTYSIGNQPIKAEPIQHQ